MKNQAILAIDGGGTRCRAVLCDADGTEIGHATGPYANLATDFEQSCQHLEDLIDATYKTCGLADHNRQGDVAVLGIAGAEIGDFASRLADQLSFARISVMSDRDIAVAGVLADRDGILAQIGTGSFFVRQHKGQTRHVGGWGLTLGDEASGAWLGRELLRQTLLAHDGLIAQSPLTRAIMARHGGRPDRLVIFAGSARPGDFAALAPELFDAFEDDDSVARHVVGRGLASLEHILTSLGADDSDSLHVTGGIGARYRELMSAPFRSRLVAPAGDALSGAVSIGRDMLAD